MSLLLSEGHTAARRYPVGMVWSEAGFVRDRFADQESTRAVLMQATIATVLGGGEALTEALEELRRGGDD